MQVLQHSQTSINLIHQMFCTVLVTQHNYDAPTHMGLNILYGVIVLTIPNHHILDWVDVLHHPGTLALPDIHRLNSQDVPHCSSAPALLEGSYTHGVEYFILCNCSNNPRHHIFDWADVPHMSQSGLIISFVIFPLSSIYSPYIITLSLLSYLLYITHYQDQYPRMTSSYVHISFS